MLLAQPFDRRFLFKVDYNATLANERMQERSGRMEADVSRATSGDRDAPRCPPEPLSPGNGIEEVSCAEGTFARIFTRR